MTQPSSEHSSAQKASFEPKRSYLLEVLEKIIKVDSPVGYYPKIEETLQKITAEFGYEMFWDHKHTAYIRVEGGDTSKTVCVGAHNDTVGLIVRGINEDGTLRVRQLGGINYASAEGASCTVHARDGRSFKGVVICNHHSVHVWDDAKTLERNEDTVSVSLLRELSSAEDVLELGLTPGALVSIDPQFELVDGEYLLTRHLDAKSCVACVLDLLRHLYETQEKPSYTTLFAFPIYEEIGHGGAYVPEEVSEYIALDISLMGPDYRSTEHQVGILAADATGPYDWNLTNELIELAHASLEPSAFNVQVGFHYSTDAMAAYRTGSNVYAAAFGPAVSNSHGRERCHVDALLNTERLLYAYLMR